jgi:hypothetical protein
MRSSHCARRDWLRALRQPKMADNWQFCRTQASRLFNYYYCCYYEVLCSFVSGVNCCIISVILLCHSFLIISDIDTVIGR